MIGTLLGSRYEITEELGEGGMGKTFIGIDTHLISRPRRVIKQLKPLENNLQIYTIIKEKFRQEAATLEKLGEMSNQIPKLYAYFEADGLFYLVQEFIEGKTLEALVHKYGPLSEIKVKEIAINLLQALEYLQNQCIIHRDIKPQNIILRESDEMPVLIDFGAVKELIGTTMAISGGAKTSIVIGTPGFMPYEQSGGRPVFASDIYALGLTMIYLLTERYPQELLNHQTGELVWRQYVPNISPGFANIIDKAICDRFQDRFLTAKDMLQAIQHLTPVKVSTQSTIYERGTPTKIEVSTPEINKKILISYPHKVLLLTSILTITVLGAVQFFWVQYKQQKLAQEKEKIEQTQQQPISEKPTEKQTETQPTPIPPQPITSPQNQTQQVDPQLSTQQTNPNNTQELVVSLPPAVPQNINLTLQNKSYISNKMAPKSIALTFDDGPDMIYTPQILDKLKEHGIKATFFILGKRLAEPGGCEIVQRIALEGHEIANHTYDHLFLSKMTPAQQREEIEKTQQLLDQCIPGYKMQWLRASYEDQNQTTLQVANELGLNTVLSTIDTNDWRQSSTIGSITNVATSTNGQDVILMHSATEVNPRLASKLASNSRENTVKALDGIITNLQGRGMTFMTLSEAFSQQ